MHGRWNTAVGMDPILTQEKIIWTLAIDDEKVVGRVLLPIINSMLIALGASEAFPSKSLSIISVLIRSSLPLRSF
jgi:hypothetical protein